jgi:hypothetical protein
MSFLRDAGKSLAVTPSILALSFVVIVVMIISSSLALILVLIFDAAAQQRRDKAEEVPFA